VRTIAPTLRARETKMAELCEHQKTAETWVVEVRPPEYECIFCHVERLEAVLRFARKAIMGDPDEHTAIVNERVAVERIDAVLGKQT
jgi:hypothetical protein